MPDALGTREDLRPGSVAPGRPHIPGETGIWVFVLGDMTMFAAFFGCFVHDRAAHVALFDRSRAQLALGFGALNTCLLLTGSLFVVWAVHAARADRLAEARRWIAAAFGCAAVFGIDKAIEYAHELARGVTPATDLFFMYFYMFTGLHALHLVIAMVVLGHLWRRCRVPALDAADRRILEVGASYWHLVDLLWVVLFALLYLMV